MVRNILFYCLAGVVACLTLPLTTLPARAEQPDLLPVDIIFAISTGYWEETDGAFGMLDPGLTIEAPATADDTKAPEEKQRGYYKLVAVRQPDGTARVHLQQIALRTNGPELLSSIEIEEFAALKAYVTDIRPESSSGVVKSPGLFATVYLKTDPKALEPESWTVLVDELGEMKVERHSN